MMAKQKYTSASTSINMYRAPAVYGNATAIEYMRGKRVIDIGGGKFDTAVTKAREYEATVSIYDPYNREPKHNAHVMATKYDVAVVSNVLNVIAEYDARMAVIEMALRKAPTVLVTVYEGNGFGRGRRSGADSWQENRKTATYETEIRESFPNVNVTRKGKLIIVSRLAF